AVVYLLWLGAGAFTRDDLGFDLVLMLSGPVTAFPLLWFSAGARRLKLSTLGFFQYIAPSTQFLLPVFVHCQPFTHAHAVTFPMIWIALALLTIDAVRRQRTRVDITPGPVALRD